MQTHLSLVLAAFAFKGVISQVSDGDEAAQIADMYSVRVRDFEQPLS